MPEGSRPVSFKGPKPAELLWASFHLTPVTRYICLGFHKSGLNVEGRLLPSVGLNIGWNSYLNQLAWL